MDDRAFMARLQERARPEIDVSSGKHEVPLGIVQDVHVDGGIVVLQHVIVLGNVIANGGGTVKGRAWVWPDGTIYANGGTIGRGITRASWRELYELALERGLVQRPR